MSATEQPSGSTPEGESARPTRRAHPGLWKNARGRRHATRVYSASLLFHLALVGVLFAIPVTRVLVGERGRDATIRIAELEEAPEPEERQELAAELEPPEVHEEPELVEEELPPEPPPELEPPPPLPDDRMQFVDPLRDELLIGFAVPVAKPLPEPAQAEVVAVPPSAEPEPQVVRKVEYKPVVLKGPDPAYPRLASRLGQEGSVTLRARVARDGRVIEVVLVSSSGSQRLDDAAIETFEGWVFRAWQVGEPELRTYLKTFTFKLPD